MGQHLVSIEVAGRRLKIACPHGQESALLLAAKEVNTRLEACQNQGKAIKTAEQTMLMVALNLANDLQVKEAQFEEERAKMQGQIDLLQDTINQAVSGDKKQA